MELHLKMLFSRAMPTRTARGLLVILMCPMNHDFIFFMAVACRMLEGNEILRSSDDLRQFAQDLESKASKVRDVNCLFVNL